EPVRYTEIRALPKRVSDRTRTGTARLTTSGARRYTTATTENGDDRTRTGGLSPDKRPLLPLSYAPKREGSAGGSRARGDAPLVWTLPVARAGFEPAISSS